jgi:hypothetical protein
LGRFLHYFSADLHNFPQNIASKRKSFSTKVFPKAGENPEKQGKIKAFQQQFSPICGKTLWENQAKKQNPKKFIIFSKKIMSNKEYF